MHQVLRIVVLLKKSYFDHIYHKKDPNIYYIIDIAIDQSYASNVQHHYKGMDVSQ